MCLIHASPHQVSLRAVTHVDMLVLSKEDLDGVLIHDESVALQVHEVAERLYPNLFPSKTNWSVYIKQTIRCYLNFNKGCIWLLFLSVEVLDWHCYWISLIFRAFFIYCWVLFYKYVTESIIVLFWYRAHCCWILFSLIWIKNNFWTFAFEIFIFFDKTLSTLGGVCSTRVSMVEQTTEANSWKWT